jgi:hypothetical protein
MDKGNCTAQEFMSRAHEIMRHINELLNNESTRAGKETVKKLSPLHDEMLSLCGKMAISIGIQEGEIKAIKTIPQTPQTE